MQGIVKATSDSIKKFIEWLLRRQKECDTEPSELNKLLGKLYAEFPGAQTVSLILTRTPSIPTVFQWCITGSASKKATDRAR